MKEFIFEVERRVYGWMKDRLSIEAETPEEALEKLKEMAEDLYYNTEWDYTCGESELEPEDKNDPDVHKVYEAGMHYIYSN